jgi:YD repeat-containing protein
MRIEELGIELVSGSVKIEYYYDCGNWTLYILNKFDSDLIYKKSDGSWNESTYDEFGNELTYKDDTGCIEYTYDSLGDILETKIITY